MLTPIIADPRGRQTASSPEDYPEIGRRMAVQFQRTSVGKIQDVLFFGTMMERLRGILSHDHNSKHKGSGRYRKGAGLKAWLEKYAPEISKPTAYKYMHVAEAVLHDFEQAHHVEVTAGRLVLADIMFAPAGDFSDVMQAKQREIFGFVAGTTLQNWLDRFRELTKAEGGEGGPSPVAEKATQFVKRLGNRIQESREKLARILPRLAGETDASALSDLRDQLVEFVNFIDRAIGKPGSKSIVRFIPEPQGGARVPLANHGLATERLDSIRSAVLAVFATAGFGLLPLGTVVGADGITSTITDGAVLEKGGASRQVVAANYQELEALDRLRNTRRQQMKELRNENRK